MTNREKIEEPIRKVLNQIWEGEIYPQEAGDLIMQLIEPKEWFPVSWVNMNNEKAENFFGQMKGATKTEEDEGGV